MIRVEEEPYWILQSLTKSCDMIRQWAEKFSSMCRMSSLDRDRLFFTNLLDMLVIRLAMRYANRSFTPYESKKKKNFFYNNLFTQDTRERGASGPLQLNDLPQVPGVVRAHTAHFAASAGAGE
jgi:hypothetical protein